MIGFSKGPWTVYAVADAISDVTAADGKVVVHGGAFKRMGVSDATARKNATLVASAPDLLDALSRALHGLKNPDFVTDSDIQAIEKTLLKARGL